MSDDTDSILPADCLSIQEIGTAAGVCLILTWVALLVCGLFMAFKAQQVEKGARKFYYLNAYICAVATFSYFAMFSGMGWQTTVGCRQFFYIRYIDWAVSTAMILLTLGLMAGQDLATILAVMGCDVGMIYAGYMGATALVATIKWMWYIFALVLFAFVVLAIIREFRQTVIDQNDVARIELYSRVSLLVLIVWALYPVVWLMAEGGGALGVSLEVMCYCLLDFFSKVIYAFMVVNHGGPYSSEPVQYSYTEQQATFERQYV